MGVILRVNATGIQRKVKLLLFWGHGRRLKAEKGLRVRTVSLQGEAYPVACLKGQGSRSKDHPPTWMEGKWGSECRRS